MNDDWTLNGAAQVLPHDLRQELDRLNGDWAERTEELRLRRGFPMTVNVGGTERQSGGSIVTEEHLRMVLENASQASAHTVLEQVKRGYVTLRGGHRIGLCGTVARRDGEITTLRYLTSLSIRVARPVKGLSLTLLEKLTEAGQFQSTLILAPPGAGKTTLLRDMVRVLSDGGTRVGLADERGEVAALWQGEPQFDVGRHTDILDGCPKAEGMSILLRGMNPQVMAADEITDLRDVQAVAEACGCGVALLATAHGGSVDDLKRRPVYRALLEHSVFRRVVLIQRRGERRVMNVEVLS